MVFKTLHAPINKFFDVTPSGLISNRFSKDMNAIDNEYAFNLTWIIDCLFWVLAAIAIGTYVSLWILIFVPVVFVLAFTIFQLYIGSYREVARLETVSNSPILTNVNESVDGTSTIRAFKKTNCYKDTNFTYLNH